MSTIQFSSFLEPVITRYLAVKRALGRSANVMEYILYRFDRFLVSQQATELTSEVFSSWSSSMKMLSVNTRIQRQRHVYQLCLFRRREEPGCFVPDPSLFPQRPARYRPHIFSDAEISQLLLATQKRSSNAPSPLHRAVSRLAVVLLYTTGMRRGELVRLTLGDYDPVNRVLLIRESKFHKTRIVPLSGDAANEIEAYLQERRRCEFPNHSDAALLLHHHGGYRGYTGAGLGDLIRKLIREAGIRTRMGRSPRVHDFRFTFAVHAMRRWYRNGVDVQSRLPALSTYMGHVSVVSTQYYLTFIDELAMEAACRFEQRCAIVIQPSGDQQ